MILSIDSIDIVLLVGLAYFLYLLFKEKPPLETVPKKPEKPQPTLPQVQEATKTEEIKEQQKIEDDSVTEEPASLETLPKDVEIPAIELPSRIYEPFSNARAVEFLSLSQEDADMFIGELIEQFDAELSNLEEAIDQENYAKIESISHMLKGSATSLGTGGVSSVLIDFNTYVKTGTEMRIIKTHMENFKHYLVDLKKVYG